MPMWRESVVIACLALASSEAVQAQWMEAKIPGEQQRTAQGCAEETRKPGDWLCVFVRCDQPGAAPSLHFSTAGAEIAGSIKVVIDDETFTLAVSPAGKSPLAMSTRAETIPDDFLEAMKAGKVFAIEGGDLKPPHNRISLQNSRKAIERIERTCMRPSAATFWRRLTRGVLF